jgi:hypothetical protein
MKRNESALRRLTPVDDYKNRSIESVWQLRQDFLQRLETAC